MHHPRHSSCSSQYVEIQGPSDTQNPIPHMNFSRLPFIRSNLLPGIPIDVNVLSFLCGYTRMVWAVNVHELGPFSSS
ncbi:uncharacterized protein MELLADRAFT_92685 [Melampsora larici-populina 98AG31]|uniref:Uncharacterized protein n=1 Tax=Melampsora larici-populina (strain 98AG31 / pathotype 3-4-7) TaxID=747676 RepID=F4S2G4_MELLP|nr:uncharacterized protein MELLADRAFT_92685 [Melampsora larici-populina 98AG31]EGG01172.1 hypothetical protein MELLADRAFT_92685 [Melampsora larici-populina 98AG31]